MHLDEVKQFNYSLISLIESVASHQNFYGDFLKSLKWPAYLLLFSIFKAALTKLNLAWEMLHYFYIHKTKKVLNKIHLMYSRQICKKDTDMTSNNRMIWN